MNQDFSIFTLVMHASWVVQLVMAGLLLASLASWTVIFGKLFGLKRVRGDNEEFEREFWAGRNLNELYGDATKRGNEGRGAPMERIFASGMREFLKLREKRVSDPGALLDGARRAMRASFQREIDAVESNLSFLASVGSVSPYVGLFAAIPAVIAYNRFARDIDRIAIQQETFIEEFSNILQRNVGAAPPPAPAAAHGHSGFQHSR